MLRPLVISETFPPDRGGMAQSCDRIVRGLRACGVQVDIAHLSARHKGLLIEQHERGRLLRCEMAEDPGHGLNLLWNALTESQSAPTHVLAFGGVLPLLSAPSFAAWLGVPLITLLRGNDFDTGIFSLRRGFLLRDALARSTAVCVVTRDHQHKVGRLYPKQRVACIPNGIDLRQWELLDLDRTRARELRATFAQERQVIGLFGHLKQKKGGAFFLDALAESGAAARTHLLIVGELEAAMEERLFAFGAALSVTRIPFLDRLELLPLYAACDLVAIPSFYDGMPNVALEAAALGVPLLTSTAGGLRDLLPATGYPLCFAPGDKHGCARALDAALTMPSEARLQLGRDLQRTVHSGFSHASEATRYQALLRETAELTSKEHD